MARHGSAWPTRCIPTRRCSSSTSLGYAVLQVNFRGSDGYGKVHRDKGWAGFGTLIEEDIHAALEVALASEPLDGSRCPGDRRWSSK